MKLYTTQQIYVALIRANKKLSKMTLYKHISDIPYIEVGNYRAYDSEALEKIARRYNITIERLKTLIK